MEAWVESVELVLVAVPARCYPAPLADLGELVNLGQDREAIPGQAGQVDLGELAAKSLAATGSEVRPDREVLVVPGQGGREQIRHSQDLPGVQEKANLGQAGQEVLVKRCQDVPVD